MQNGLPFWCQLTQVVLEKRPLNGCSVVIVVSWSLTSLFSTNMAISEMKGQGWRVILTQ